jgi:TRAF-type zinc finger
MDSDSNGTDGLNITPAMENSINAEEHQPTDIDYFTSSDIKNFQCPICFRIPLPDYAYEDSVCGNIFCKECINACISHTNICPMCRNQSLDSSKRKIREKNIGIYTFMQNLEIKCPSNTMDDHEVKCLWAGFYKDLPTHIKNECINTFVDCPNNCCLKIKRDMVEAHALLCDNRKEVCLYCQLEVESANINKHILHECTDPSNTERIIKCEFSRFGCKKEGKITEMRIHGSDMSAHFILEAKIVDNISKINNGIKQRLDILSGKVQQIEKCISPIKSKNNRVLFKAANSKKGSVRCPSNTNHELSKMMKIDEFRKAKCNKCNQGLNSDSMKCTSCNCYYCSECIPR